MASPSLIGSVLCRNRCAPGAARRSAGFVYLWMLIIVMMSGIAAAAMGQQWIAMAQREKEAELEFRGQQIADAIASYWAAAPGPAKDFPQTLQDLVEDRRGLHPAHHLRKLYADPFTGEADWVLIPANPGDPTGRFRGVRSRSMVLAMRVSPTPVPSSASSSAALAAAPASAPFESSQQFIFTAPAPSNP